MDWPNILQAALLVLIGAMASGTTAWLVARGDREAEIDRLTRSHELELERQQAALDAELVRHTEQLDHAESQRRRTAIEPLVLDLGDHLCDLGDGLEQLASAVKLSIAVGHVIGPNETWSDSARLRDLADAALALNERTRNTRTRLALIAGVAVPNIDELWATAQSMSRTAQALCAEALVRGLDNQPMTNQQVFDWLSGQNVSIEKQLLDWSEGLASYRAGLENLMLSEES